MGLFKGKLGNAFSNVINTVVGGATSLVSGLIKPVGGLVTDTIKVSAPVIKDVANSPAGTAFASSFGVNGGSQITQAKVKVSEQPENEPKKGFFDYKNDDGSYNVNKIVLHSAIALTGVGLLYLAYQHFS